MSRATVALDARLVGYAAGIAQYAVQLAAALAALPPAELDYLALLGRRTPRDYRSETRAIRLQIPPHHRLERLALPAEIIARTAPRPPGILHSLDHVAPAWGPWRSVLTVHDLAFLTHPETHTAASRQYYAHTRQSVRRATRVIAVSRFTADELRRLLDADPRRLLVVPEAAAPHFQPRPRADFERLAANLGLDPARPYVLFVGTIEPRKNLPLLLRAFQALPHSLDARLLVVGAAGWLDAPIYRLVNELQLGERARFLGRVPDEALAVLYSHAAVFALPSVYEGFGLPLLEAMACGAPVVTSNTGPLPEVAGDSAVLLPPSDPTRWADALTDILRDPQAANQLRQAGFARARQFSWRQTAEQTQQVYWDTLRA